MEVVDRGVSANPQDVRTWLDENDADMTVTMNAMEVSKNNANATHNLRVCGWDGRTRVQQQLLLRSHFQLSSLFTCATRVCTNRVCRPVCPPLGQNVPRHHGLSTSMGRLAGVHMCFNAKRRTKARASMFCTSSIETLSS